MTVKTLSHVTVSEPFEKMLLNIFNIFNQYVFLKKFFLMSFAPECGSNFNFKFVHSGFFRLHSGSLCQIFMAGARLGDVSFFVCLLLTFSAHE